MPDRKPLLLARYSPLNQAWIVTFGDSLCPIGPDARSVFASLDDLTAYLAATRTDLVPIAHGPNVRQLI